MSNHSKTPTYGTEALTVDGYTWRAGDLVCPRNCGVGFNTHMVLGFGKSEFNWGSPRGIETNWYARLARPYGVGNCIGTTGPGMLTTAEVYEVSIQTLKDWDHSPEKHRTTRCEICSPCNDTAEVK